MKLQQVITRLSEIKEHRAVLDMEEKSLSTPSVTNTDLLPTILEYCREAFTELHPQGGVRSSEERRVYIFILLFLYSPRTLSGGKMSKGLRVKIASALGVESSNLSHYHADIWFRYQIYDDFRNDVNKVFEKVFEKLRKK